MVSIPSVLIYLRDSANKEQEILLDAEVKSAIVTQLFNDEFSDVLQDIFFFSKNPAFAEYLLEDDLGSSSTIIERTTGAFLNIRNSYLEFNLIDTNGRERLAIDCSKGQSKVEHSNKDYSRNPIFSQLKKLKKNEIFISRFEKSVNIDSGQVREAIIRFVMPVYSRRIGEKAGYVQFNFSGNRIFDRLEQLEISQEVSMALLDKNGLFIKGPNHGLNFWDDASSKKHLQEIEFPLESELLVDSSESWSSKEGLFYATKFQPLSQVNHPKDQIFANKLEYLILITYAPDYINGLNRKLALDLLLYACTILLFLIPSILFLYRLVKQKNLELKEKTHIMESKNKDLEKSQSRLESNIKKISEYALENNRNLAQIKLKEKELKTAQNIAQLSYYERDVKNETSTWSDNLPHIFGLPDDYDFNIDSIKSIMKPDEYEEMRNAFKEAVTQQKEYRAIYRVFHKDGKRDYVQDIAQPIIENNEVVAMKGTIQNLTERVKIEKELLNAKVKAEQAVKAKSDFLATMSHEIRTPLNAVLGMATLLDETSLDEKQKDFVQTIKVSGDSLLSVINDILDFSKIESDQMEFENRPFSLNQLIEDGLQVISVTAARKKLKLFYKIDKDVPQTIYGDESRIRQCLINLLNNAVKFTERGEVQVMISSDKIDDDHVKLKMSIIDTGIGIEEEKLLTIFSAFQQADTSITRKFGGSGLGLAITQNLIKLMGGSLHVNSQIAEGSEFYFLLDVKTERQENKKNLVLKTASIVSAETQERDALVTTLQEQGLTVNLFGFESTSFSDLSTELVFLLCEPELREECIQLGESLKPLSQNLFFITNVQKGLAEFKSFNTISRPLKFSWLEQLLYVENFSAEKAKAKPIVETNLFPDLNILVAEDNPVNQKLITLLFENIGYKIHLAENGVMAVKAAQNKKFDLIFMDIQMPQMSGVEATKYIKEDHGENAPPIIALTANALDGDRDKYLADGLDDYLSKPINMLELKAMIIKWASKME